LELNQPQAASDPFVEVVKDWLPGLGRSSRAQPPGLVSRLQLKVRPVIQRKAPGGEWQNANARKSLTRRHRAL
jgi:hypothetical protein